MADNTILQQGLFTSTGVAKTIVLRSDIDWMMTWNLTTIAGSTQWDSVRHYWQRELPVGDHVIDFHAAATQVVSTTTGIVGFNGVANRPGFYLIDSSGMVPGAPIAVTAGTNATQPVYSTGTTIPLQAGAIVRVQNTAHTNLNGLDFSVDTVVPATSFRLANTLATAPGAIAGALGTYRYIAPDLATYKLFYPGNRVIANITAAHPAVVTTLVDHGYTSGQIVRMKVPAACGMTQMNDLTGVVTALTAATFSINIDATAFTAFNFPLPAAVPFTPAEVIPMGDIATTLLGSTRNQGYIGIILGSGGAVSGSPAGVNNDVIKWVAGKSFATHIG